MSPIGLGFSVFNGCFFSVKLEPAFFSAIAWLWACRWGIRGREYARVFPEPVGANPKTFAPLRIEGQAYIYIRWGYVFGWYRYVFMSMIVICYAGDVMWYDRSTPEL